MTVRPLVGITSYLEEAAWGVWRQPAALLPQSYLNAVSRSGATPVLLPPQTGDTGRLLDRLDGLVIAGGSDIDPARYGAPAHPLTDLPHELRDAWEFDLLRGALDRDLPLLGVCRGMQLLNVALGGDLVQHLPDQVGGEDHKIAPGTYNRQPVLISPGSRLGGIMGRSAKVPCYHHQAIGRLGSGLRATAWSADESVEAVELPDHSFALGVQWHPEADPTDARLFDAFVLATRKETKQ
ncbi:gamma-glutamyl-gamma-aminobutyrate hydrolase family protein [Kitasatospora sp. MAP5-34]|uniref:gamma-glutamyl-gamma-aminobutyrate hydrolase family protein n=1 Tax=Kitasatospora sp. MAP5-34 TaxID=3035102 RepID=UPI002473BE0C|nr:gamma-glutamyl-gamma-aminobutyrate hydrolase family protein [Kitasatospora sp. MAP5-34]MDH6574533.1 putative glutamine amidotransferase [Kitasatospora sp. MAP5-34]